MSTSKRLLALLLCVAIVMGLCTTAFAAVSEEEYASVNSKIQWLIDNGYVEGDDNGLRAEDSITRAEFATILARALASKDEYEAYANLANGFTDVAATDWFAGAVNYCFSVNAVAGFGDGTFQPNANVTGIQAAKMILVGILGYDEADYVGSSNWNFNAYKDADAAGLLEDVTGASDLEATRGDCFTMLYNALYVAGVVEPVVCAGAGLAYIKDYDVAAMYLVDGDGASDEPFEYELAKGVYTANSFKAVCGDAAVTLYEYVADTTTGKGVLTAVQSITLGDDTEKYFFVEVACADNDVWYKFTLAGAYAYDKFEGIVIANEYADLYADEPTEAGQTKVETKDGVITVAATTTLDDLGMTFEGETLASEKGVYNVASFALKEGADIVTIVTDAEAYADLFKQGPTALKYADEAECFENFDNYAEDMVEILEVVKDTNGEVIFKKGAIVSKSFVVAAYNGTLLYYASVDAEPVAKKAAAAAEMTKAAFMAKYTAEADDANMVGLFDADDFRAGYVYKFINNVDTSVKKDEEVDFGFVLTSFGAASYETKPDDDIGAATSFCGVEFGGDDGKSVSVVTVIDGYTYITAAPEEIVIPAKNAETEFDSEIATSYGEGPETTYMSSYKYLVCDELDTMIKGETYYVYYDLLGNSFAAKNVGVGDYALVTQISSAKGNLRGYTYEASLVFGEAEEEDYTATFSTLNDLTTFGFDSDNFNGVVNTLDVGGCIVFWRDNQWNRYSREHMDNGPSFWTALASYYNKDEEAKTVTLLDPVTNYDVYLASLDVENDIKAGTDYIPVSWFGDDYDGDEKVYLTDATEIYVVTGVDTRLSSNKELSGMLTKCEYSVGYKTLPAILEENIHGVYGVIEEVAKDASDVTKGYKMVADVIVIEVFQNNPGKGVFVIGDTTIEGIDIDDSTDSDYRSNAVGFGVMNGDVLAMYGDNLSDYSYEDIDDYIESWHDYYISDVDISSAAFVLGSCGTDDYGWRVAADVPVYVINATAKGYELVEAVNPNGAKRDDTTYQVGDQLILVENATQSETWQNMSATYILDSQYFAYIIDLTQSCHAVKEYFGFGGTFVATGTAGVVNVEGEMFDFVNNANSYSSVESPTGIIAYAQESFSFSYTVAEGYTAELTVMVGGSVIPEATPMNNGYTKTVNPATGEVIITIPEIYFETDCANTLASVVAAFTTSKDQGIFKAWYIEKDEVNADHAMNEINKVSKAYFGDDTTHVVASGKTNSNTTDYLVIVLNNELDPAVDGADYLHIIAPNMAAVDYTMGGTTGLVYLNSTELGFTFENNFGFATGEYTIQYVDYTDGVATVLDTVVVSVNNAADIAN